MILTRKTALASALMLTMASTTSLLAEPIDADSLIRRQPAGAATDLNEVVVYGDVRSNNLVSTQPLSSTSITAADMERLQMRSMKDFGAFMPNLFIPDYGSRLTSALYVRGVGSRLNTPAVGMMVDNVAQGERSTFDTSMDDVVGVSLLRGPQSTIYGRNTMGGLLQIYTFNPLSTRIYGPSARVSIGGSTRDAGRHISARYAGAVGQDAAFSLSAFYRGNDGYNRNAYLHRRSNGAAAAGGKFRYVYNPVRHPGFFADFQTSLEYSNEHGYDYYNTSLPKQIVENELGSYRRTLLNSSLRLESVGRTFTVSSITAAQVMNDRMFMDQDFTSADVFTLEQRQKHRQLSEEVIFKSNRPQRLDWLAGAFFLNQWMDTDAPVTFGQDGVERYIQSGINTGFAAANAAMNPLGMNLALNVNDPRLLIDGTFKTPLLNAAAYTQWTLHRLFIPQLDLTAGLRLDYEHRRMDYNTGTATHYDFVMTRGQRAVIDQSFTTESRYEGSMQKDFTQLLPRFVLSYNLPHPDDIIYASVSKGFRSGGYNLQMFSELLQTSLRNDMMRTLAEDPALGASLSRHMSIADNPSASELTTYKPETSWNYELGTHLGWFDNRLQLRASLFYIRTRNQQITRFAATGLGRQTVNAGKSESWGGEAELTAQLQLFHNPFTLRTSYGYTHATFTDYDAGVSGNVAINYDDNYVPFAPQHNLGASFEYVVPIGDVYLQLGANVNALGRIYWTEDNSLSQPFYALLGAHAGISRGAISLNFWGRNLTNTKYSPFTFVSMSNVYSQTCRPVQFGVDLTWRL